MKFFKLVFLLTFVLVSFGAKAQLYFKNNTNEPVFVAICMFYDNKDSKYFGSEGWWKVEPGDKVQVSSAIGFNDNIYYYAYSSTSKKKYAGETKLIVHPKNKFFIKNADKSTIKNKIHPMFGINLGMLI
ncbi:MAG: DUF1036 domain-containing protein [Bacteroidetes bacterium]|nr:DUF1036 domain-containing protein [Bacteroidota bacterium]